MPEPSQLLYLLSDAAYLASLIPGKKDHSFEIHNYRQINGSFLNDQGCLAANVDKLFGKIDKGSLELILPDQLFTNTIIEVEETSEAKVKEVIKTKLLPDLGLNQDTHLLKPFILNQYANKSRVQLTALEKKVVAPIVKASLDHGLKINSIVPLSWTLKSLISLEPSICVVQFQNQLQLALHYIGIDQTSYASLSDLDKLSETIKTLKGAQPSIQTVYLLSDPKVQKDLEKLLSDGLPIQQLVSDQADEQIPGSIQLAIESGMKTLSIDEFAVPAFDLPKLSDVEEHLEKIPALAKDDLSDSEVQPIEDAKKDDESSDAQSAVGSKDSDEETADKSLPKQDEDAPSLGSDELKLDKTPPPPPPTPATQDIGGQLEKASELDLDFPDSKEEKAMKASAQTPIKATLPSQEESTPKEVSALVSKDAEKVVENEESLVKNPDSDSNQALQSFGSSQESQQSGRKVIKNRSGISPFLKVAFIGLAVFFTTIAVGLGIGMVFLNWFQPSAPQPTPVVMEIEEPDETQVEPTPEPTPEPTEELDVSELSGLVVNATTRAGFAGEVQTTILAGEFEGVSARNARGDYEAGTYLLVTSNDDTARALRDLIEELTGFSLEISTDKAV